VINLRSITNVAPQATREATMAAKRDKFELRFANQMPKILPPHVQRAIAGVLRRFAEQQKRPPNPRPPVSLVTAREDPV
jgi:hypothetical protein